MKLPEFKLDEMEWDSWHSFHVDVAWNKFVQFDTGEFVVVNKRWNPDKREVHNDLRIQIVATSDDNCPRLYLPNTPGPMPVAKSHLNHKGHQILLIDFDHKRAVSVDRYLDKDNVTAPIPERFTNSEHRCGGRISAYYAGPNAVPIGTPITRHFPHPLTSEQRKRIDDLKSACDVWLKMQPNPEALAKEQHKFKAPPVAGFIYAAFSTVLPAQRALIAVHGFDMILKEEHPWLILNEGATDGQDS